jgi:hypothetical protein
MGNDKNFEEESWQRSKKGVHRRQGTARFFASLRMTFFHEIEVLPWLPGKGR